MKKNRTVSVFIISILLVIAIPSQKTIGENVLKLALDSDPTNIDPRFARDVNSARVYQIVMNGLFQKAPNLQIVPCLVEHWEMPDDKTYVFFLKKGVKFHNSSELTAEDVKFTFESILDPELNSPRAAAYEPIKDIEILAPYTIKFTLHEVFPPFLAEMIHPILSKEATEAQEGGKFTDTLIGTGPFKLIEWKHDEHLIFEAHSEYFEGAPKLDQVVCRIIPDETIAFLELKQGGLNFLQNMIPPDMVSLAENTKGINVVAQESIIIQYLAFNLTDPILKDINVRRAIAHTIDRSAMITHLLKGYALPATGLLSSSNWAYEPNVHHYNYDVEKGKALLDEAGFPDPDGNGPKPRFSITYIASTDSQAVRIGEVLQAQLEDVGIAIEVQTFEWAKFLDDILTGNFQMYALNWVGIIEPDAFHSIFHSSMLPPHGNNFGQFMNSQIDELTEKGRSTVDIQERKQLYSRIQKILSQDLPYIYLWYPQNIIAMDNRVHGFIPCPDGNVASFKDVWIEE